MNEIALQLKGGTLHPFSLEDAEKLKSYRENQVLKARVSGVKKARSYKQLRTYWGGCRTVAENTEDPQWNTPERVDFQCRVGCHFVDPELVAVKPSGEIVFSYKSIAFANLEHAIANGYFDGAFKLMAKKLGCTVDELMRAIAERTGNETRPSR